MTVFTSSWNAASAAAQQRRDAMLARIAQLRALEDRAAQASARSRPVFDKRGQLLPRERVALVLDAGAPWLPLCSLAGFLQDTQDPEASIPGGGIVAGIGFISGVRCMVVASDSGIEAGAIQLFTSAPGPVVSDTSALGNVTAIDSYGFPVADSDTALVDALFDGLTIQKTASLDGNCPGSELVTVLPGTAATYCYLVTNTGDTAVTDIDVSAGTSVALLPGWPRKGHPCQTIWPRGSVVASEKIFQGGWSRPCHGNSGTWIRGLALMR